MAAAIVGRDEELEALRAFLDRATARGPTGLALEGEAGIGKSTLWHAAVEDARVRGLRVLTTRAAESERGLAHAGLGDLLEPVLDDVLPELSPPRRRALEVALLLEDADGRAVDARALAVAVRSVLELLAEDALLVAVDDLQWLDRSTAGALAFALRRLSHGEVRIVWTRRVGEPHAAQAVEDALEGVERIAVGPLSVGALHAVVRELLGRPLARPRLLRLHEASGGNPFYALELARALADDDPDRDPTAPFAVPARLEELLSARLLGYGSATRRALALVSADARLTAGDLVAAGIDLDALAPAVDGGVVEAARETLRFTHPLLASVLYQALSPGERREAHRRLAGIVSDSVARARHLALSTDEPDAGLAEALEQAALSASRRGAPAVAAELGEHAVRLTPSDDGAALDRRTISTVRAHLATGAIERAQVLAAGLLERAAPGPPRAEALALAAEVEGDAIGPAIDLQRAALAEPGTPAALRAVLHRQLSLHVRYREGLAAAEEHARAAAELGEELDDDGLRAGALAGLALVRFNRGKKGALRLAEQAVELAGVDEASGLEARFTLAHVLVWSGAHDRARALLEHLYERWGDRDERHAAYALWYLAVLELRHGRRLDVADDYATRARELSSAYARRGEEAPQTLYPSTLIAAHRGDLTRARDLAEQVVRLAALHDTRLYGPFAALGLVELWSGDPEAAVAQFAAAERTPNAGDGHEPAMSWWRADQAEALLELGRVDEAAARIEPWEAAAQRLGRGWALAEAARCRGLISAARGDVEQALALLAHAAGAHAAEGAPFGRARALLSLGTVARRARQKRSARDAIEAARTIFDELGAARWAERAAAELGRIGGRTRIEGLTPAERRVADLVAAGHTNAEVAAALYLAERTVSSHLTHVYAKLGVRSRTELSRALALKVPTS